MAKELDRTVIIRASTQEYRRWKKNIGNISLTIRALLDVHCKQIEDTRAYTNHCFRQLEEAELELIKKGGKISGEIRANK